MEIKELTGIDIYKYPFDKEAGYACIKEENVEILILKLETLNKNMKILGEFVGCENIDMVKGNDGVEKYYIYIYNEIKKSIKLSRDLFISQYEQNTRFNHFYTEKEKQSFYKKWEKNIQ